MQVQQNLRQSRILNKNFNIDNHHINIYDPSCLFQRCENLVLIYDRTCQHVLLHILSLCGKLTSIPDIFNQLRQLKTYNINFQLL